MLPLQSLEDVRMKFYVDSNATLILEKIEIREGDPKVSVIPIDLSSPLPFLKSSGFLVVP